MTKKKNRETIYKHIWTGIKLNYHMASFSKELDSVSTAFRLSHPPSSAHQAAATLVSLLSLHLAWHTATSGPLHFFFFSCLDLAFFKSLGISLSHLLSSLFPCVLWDAPYTLLKNPHLSFTISSLLSFFSFKFVTWSTKYLYIVLFTYFIVCPHTPLEYSFCKGRILF